MNEKFNDMKRTLLADMVRYMEYGSAEDEDDIDYDPEFDAGYTLDQVNQCGDILDTYLEALTGLAGENNNERIMEAVKCAVLDLNELNSECDDCMIETDQREQLCDLIISAAKHAGLVTDEYDVTEEWREW